MKYFCKVILFGVFGFFILVAPFIAHCMPSTSGIHSMLSPELEIERQDVTISPDIIKYSYLIVNTSKQDIIQTLVTGQSGNINVDEQYIECNLNQVALSFVGNDISGLLKSHGLPFDPIQALHSIDASPNRDTIRKKLIALNLLHKDDEAPQWTTSSYCYWTQIFPAEREIKITHSFKPVTTIKQLKLKSNGGILQAPVSLAKSIYNLTVNWTLDEKFTASKLQSQLEKLNPELKEFCPNIKDFQALTSVDTKYDPNKKVVECKEIYYSFLNDSLYTTPSKLFTLKIITPANMHPMFCWQGNMKSSSKNNLVFEAENYLPIHPIHILFVER